MSLPTEACKKIHSEAIELAERKNNDYAGVVDVIGTMGRTGLAVRMFDKASRIASLVLGTNQKVKDESIRDTAIDMINYATYLVCILDGTWNGGK